MPASIKGRRFQPIYHQPPPPVVKTAPKTKIDPSDVFGTKGRQSKYNDPTKSDRQEGMNTGQLTDYLEEAI